MPAKFDRCVKKVKARGGVYNAYAVCNAAMKRARRNPVNFKNAGPLLWIAGGGLAAFAIYKLWPSGQQTPPPQGGSIACGAMQAQLNVVNGSIPGIPTNPSAAANIRQQMVSAGCTPIG